MEFRLGVPHMRSPVAEGVTGLPRSEVRHLLMWSTVAPHMRAQCSERRGRNVQTVTEKWRFHCLHCSRSWEDLYEARYCGDATAWRSSGVLVQPPWADPICPECRSLRVKVLPAGVVAQPGAGEVTRVRVIPAWQGRPAWSALYGQAQRVVELPGRRGRGAGAG